MPSSSPVTDRHGFNPRSRAGSDLSDMAPKLGSQQFQSALPRGERRGCRRLAACFERFNPRSRAGSDPRLLARSHLGAVSIRAPARGATWPEATSFPPSIMFQSALPPGSNSRQPDRRRGPQMFQSALPRGERRPVNEAIPRSRIVSIRAPARGATKVDRSSFYRVIVSIRAPARGATTEKSLQIYWDGVSIRAPARGATFSHSESKWH